MPVDDSEIFLVLLIANQLCDVRANGRFDKIGAIFSSPDRLAIASRTSSDKVIDVFLFLLRLYLW